MRIHCPFPMHQAARINGGRLVVIHEHGCYSHRGGECGCRPSFKLWRAPKRMGGRPR